MGGCWYLVPEVGMGRLVVGRGSGPWDPIGDCGSAGLVVWSAFVCGRRPILYSVFVPQLCEEGCS